MSSEEDVWTEKMIIVVGINKIVRDIEEADKRIKMYAAPMNIKRYDIHIVVLGENLGF